MIRLDESQQFSALLILAVKKLNASKGRQAGRLKIKKAILLRRPSEIFIPTKSRLLRKI